MNHLVNLVKFKAGITDEQARAAVDVMISQFKQKFPQILHPEIDSVANGGNFGDSVRGKIEELKGSFVIAARNVGEKAGTLGEELADKLHEIFNPKRPPSSGTEH
ncbi:MAG: hypothetical protein IT242_05770 [Bacteroidia bacterium]|nr:hypothetical protein [Bacteroidia bacterium]